MNKKVIDRIVWWIPFKKLRDDLREYMKSSSHYDMIIASDSNDWTINNIREGIINNKNFYNSYNKLISNLDNESIFIVSNILSKLSNFTDINDHIYFYKKEYESLKEIEFIHNSKIIKFGDKQYMYDNKYILSSPSFEIVNFYDRMYIDSINIDNIKNKAIIDAGAWIGDTALILSKYTDNKVYAFEALYNNYNKMKDNIEINNINNIIPICMALGEENKIIYLDDFNAGCMMTANSSLEKDNNKIEVEMTTLDSFVEKNNIEVGLIKTDLEGFEQPFLRGALNTIKKYKPALIISIYHNYSDFFDIKPMIESLNLGYKFKIRKGHELNASVGTLLIAEV